jgi:hypothetical protein
MTAARFGLIALGTCLAVGFPVGTGQPEPLAPTSLGTSLTTSAAAAEPVRLAPRPALLVGEPAWLLANPTTEMGRDATGRLSPAIAEGLGDWWATPTEPGALALIDSFDDEEAGDLRTLLLKGERWHLLRFDGVVTAQPLARVTAFGTIPYRPRVSDNALAPDDSYVPALLGVTGEIAGFEVGAQYRSLGERLDRVVRQGAGRKDVEGVEVWLARRFGPVRLRLSQSDLSDNVDQNPAFARTTTSETGLTAELTLPGGPLLSLTYGGGDSRRDRPPAEARAHHAETFQSVTGSAYYLGEGWEASASTTYRSSREAVGPHDETAALYHSVSLTLCPTEAVTVTPTLSAGSEHYPATARWDTGSASLTLSYAPPTSRWHAWSTIAYATTGSDGRVVESGGVSIGGGLAWELGRSGALRSTLSAARYDDYRDRAAPANSSRGAFALVLFSVSGF